MIKLFTLSFSIMTILTLTACGPSNTVKLLNQVPLEQSVIPAPNAPRISVAKFEDKRIDTTSIGTRRDNTAFVTNDNVAEWVSRSLADELARHGMQVTFASSVTQARNSNPDYLVTGSVEEVKITEQSSIEISAHMKAECILANRQKRLLREPLATSQTQSGIHSNSTADDLLLETLKDIIKPMAQKIIQTIQAKK